MRLVAIRILLHRCGGVLGEPESVKTTQDQGIVPGVHDRGVVYPAPSMGEPVGVENTPLAFIRPLELLSAAPRQSGLSSFRTASRSVIGWKRLLVFSMPRLERNDGAASTYRWRCA